MSVQLHYSHVSLSNHIRSSGFVSDQSQLSKVVTSLVLHHFLRGFASLDSLGSDCLTILDNIEVIALVTFLNDQVVRLELFLFEGIRQLASLVVVHALEDLNSAQELLILLSLLLSCILHNVIESVSIQRVQLTLLRGSDRCCTRCVVK